jgi:hypothetical protein
MDHLNSLNFFASALPVAYIWAGFHLPAWS